MARLTIKDAKAPAVTITREAVKADVLVYIAVANKTIAYPHGKSRIIYIGSTEKGAQRMAASAADKAQEMLDKHGVSALEFYPLTCTDKPDVQTWLKLERGLILSFKHMFGTVPMCNVQGKNVEWADELDYFTRERLESLISKYSK